MLIGGEEGLLGGHGGWGERVVMERRCSEVMEGNCASRGDRLDLIWELGCMMLGGLTRVLLQRWYGVVDSGGNGKGNREEVEVGWCSKKGNEGHYCPFVMNIKGINDYSHMLWAK